MPTKVILQNIIFLRTFTCKKVKYQIFNFSWSFILIFFQIYLYRWKKSQTRTHVNYSIHFDASDVLQGTFTDLPLVWLLECFSFVPLKPDGVFRPSAHRPVVVLYQVRPDRQTVVSFHGPEIPPISSPASPFMRTGIGNKSHCLGTNKFVVAGFGFRERGGSIFSAVGTFRFASADGTLGDRVM